MQKPIIAYLIITLIAFVLFFPGLGIVPLFDWDEINFAESAREMIATGNFHQVTINYQPFWEKPPFFFWLQVLSMQMFGVGEYAARFPNAIAGLCTLLVLFCIGRKQQNSTFAWVWVLLYIGSFLPHFYFKSGIIDPWFNLFILLGVHALAQLTHQKQKIKYAIMAGFALGMGILTKGPVALLIPMLCGIVYFFMRRHTGGFAGWPLLWFSISISVPVFAWLGIELATNGTWFIHEFIEYQIRLFRTGDSGHGQPFYYHPLVLLLGCFPASIFFFGQFFKNSVKTEEQENHHFWMNALFWVTLMVFSVVKTKIVHYSSLCYFPLTYLAASYLHKQIEDIADLHTFLKRGLMFFGMFWSLLLIILLFLLKNPQWIIPHIGDVFAAANLEAETFWKWYDISGGIVLGFGVMYFIRNRLTIRTFIGLMIATTFTVQWVLYRWVPNIELITQHAAISFFESKAQKDCYVHAIGYKSYAHYFYSKRKPNYPKGANVEDWLLYGKIDKPVYLVTKVDRDHYHEIPGLKKIYTRNGFVFYERMPQ